MNEQPDRITIEEARRRMHEADRDRACIAYAGTQHLHGAAENARVNRNRKTPEYLEAQERFDRYSALVGNEGPRDLTRMLRL